MDASFFGFWAQKLIHELDKLNMVNALVLYPLKMDP